MAILAGLAVISIFEALLRLTQQRTSLHITIFSALIPAAFLFGHEFGLSAGFLIAIGVMPSVRALYRLYIELPCHSYATSQTWVVRLRP